MRPVIPGQWPTRRTGNYSWIWVEVEPGIYSVIVDGCSFEVAINWLWRWTWAVSGMRVEREDPRKWNPAAAARKGSGRESVTTPMPGKIVRLLVAEGDEITAGQGLVVVEAMKMQNEMKAPRAGRVVSIAVKPPRRRECRRRSADHRIVTPPIRRRIIIRENVMPLENCPKCKRDWAESSSLRMRSRAHSAVSAKP